MSLIRSSQTVHINSKFRSNGTDDNFNYTIDLNKNNAYTHVCVLSISIPKSYYLVGDGENTFIIDDGGVLKTVTLPIGNYSISSFLYTLNNIFQHGNLNLNHYSVTIPDGKLGPQTGKMTFVHNSISHASSFIFDNSHLPEIMGFERGSINPFIMDQKQSYLISTNICNFQKESTIFLHSSVCNNSYDDILLEVFSSSSPDLSNINYEVQNIEAHSKPITSSQNNSYKFHISDEYDKAIKLNGVNLLITLLFYQKEDLNRLIRGYLKYKILLDSEENDNKQT